LFAEVTERRSPASEGRPTKIRKRSCPGTGEKRSKNKRSPQKKQEVIPGRCKETKIAEKKRASRRRQDKQAQYKEEQ